MTLTNKKGLDGIEYIIKNNLFAIGSRKGFILLWNKNKKKLLRVLHPTKNKLAPMNCILY